MAPRPRSEDLVLVPRLFVALFLAPVPNPNSSLDEEGCTGGGGGGGAAKAAAKEAREEAEEDQCMKQKNNILLFLFCLNILS